MSEQFTLTVQLLEIHPNKQFATLQKSMLIYSVAYKILISGYYGYDNLGDEAILSALSTTLKNLGHTVTALSAHPLKTRQTHQIAAGHRYWGLLPALLKHNVFISGGGGLLQDKTSLRSLYYYLGTIKLAKLLGKKVIVYGQSIGPLSSKARAMLTKILQDVPIAVRDKASQDLLASLGLTAQLTADAALLLAPVPQKSASVSKKVLLIARANYPKLTQELIKIGKDYEKQSIPLATFAMHPSEDYKELNTLKKALPNLEVLKIETVPQALEHIAKASYIVSVRLHGLILAARVRTPFKGLVYDPKVKAFLEEVGAHPFQESFIGHPIADNALNINALEQLEARAKWGINWLNGIILGVDKLEGY